MRILPRKYAWLALAVALASFWLPSVPAYATQSVSLGGNQMVVAGEQEFEAGFVLLPRVPIFWESDGSWRLTVSAADPNLGASSDASYVKSLADLSWKLAGTQAWMPLTQDAEEVDSSDKTGSGVIYLDMAVRLNWLKDAPGDYNVNLIITIEPL
jgi:hypothetical protein